MKSTEIKIDRDRVWTLEITNEEKGRVDKSLKQIQEGCLSIYPPTLLLGIMISVTTLFSKWGFCSPVFELVGMI